MKVYVVHQVRRSDYVDDTLECNVVGVYTDLNVARKVALVSRGRYQEIEVDHVFPEIKDAAPKFRISL